MTTTPVNPDGTPLRFQRPYALRHDGPCGERRQCWRPECLAAFGELRTVEILKDGRALAYCHRAANSYGHKRLEAVA